MHQYKFQKYYSQGSGYLFVARFPSIPSPLLPLLEASTTIKLAALHSVTLLLRGMYLCPLTAATIQASSSRWNAHWRLRARSVLPKLASRGADASCSVWLSAAVSACSPIDAAH